jgi:hypothetical protein
VQEHDRRSILIAGVHEVDPEHLPIASRDLDVPPLCRIADDLINCVRRGAKNLHVDKSLESSISANLQ